MGERSGGDSAVFTRLFGGPEQERGLEENPDRQTRAVKDNGGEPAPTARILHQDFPYFLLFIFVCFISRFRVKIIQRTTNATSAQCPAERVGASTF